MRRRQRLVKVALLGRDEQVETLWAEPLGGDRYRLRNIPFFAYGVSLGDVIAARPLPDDEWDDDALPFLVEVVQRAGNATLRLGLIHRDQRRGPVPFTIDDPELEPVRRALRGLGCGAEGFSPRLLAVNVPPTTALDEVMALLQATPFEWENGDPETAQVRGRVAYRFELAAQGEDQLGGICPGLPAARWPRCGGCQTPMTFVMLLRSHPQRLRLRCSAAVALFRCARCRDLPEDRRSAVWLLGPAQVAAGTAACWRPPGPAIQPRQLHYHRVVEGNPLANPGLVLHGGLPVDKVGGYPQWIAGDQTPSCPSCARPMWLVAQLRDGLDRLLDLAGGAGYLFVCRDEHGGRFVTQRPPRN